MGGKLNALARYVGIADELETKIRAGEYPPGTTLPRQVDLVKEFGVSRETIREAIAILELRGLVRSVRGQGAYVRDGDINPTMRLDRGRQVYRNELGYLFNALSAHWRPVSTPTSGWTTVTDEVAAALGVPPGTEVFGRHRVLGPDRNQPLQYTSSYFRADFVRGTVIETPDTGPGGWMDRAEHDLGHGPLSWEEELTARPPAPDEARALQIASSLWLLVMLRTTTSGRTQETLAVDLTRVPADRFAIRYPIERSESAAWPTQPVSLVNTPSGSA